MEITSSTRPEGGNEAGQQSRSTVARFGESDVPAVVAEATTAAGSFELNAVCRLGLTLYGRLKPGRIFP